MSWSWSFATFQLDTERVREAVDVAEKTKSWILSKKVEGKFFEQQLIKHLKNSVSISAAREKMWGNFHRLRCSPAFKLFWTTLLTLIGCNTVDDPIFSQ